MNQSLAKLNLLKKKAQIPKEKWMNPKKKKKNASNQSRFCACWTRP
jgi:hypothetical protein